MSFNVGDILVIKDFEVSKAYPIPPVLYEVIDIRYTYFSNPARITLNKANSAVNKVLTLCVLNNGNRINTIRDANPDNFKLYDCQINHDLKDLLK